MSKVFIVGSNAQYDNMFADEGWEVVLTMDDADLVQFTGGEDVTPFLYSEPVHKRTYYNENRDYFELDLFETCVKEGKKMAGICRGGQFLNVANGGKMWQHVNNHGLHGTHPAVNVLDGVTYQVTSTHHQMMRPAKQGMVLLVAKNIASIKEHMINDKGVIKTVVVTPGHKEHDVEAVYYPRTKSLCFQPHPEMSGGKGCRGLYFHYLSKYLELE